MGPVVVWCFLFQISSVGRMKSPSVSPWWGLSDGIFFKVMNFHHPTNGCTPPCILNLHDDGILGFLWWFLGSPNLGLEWWFKEQIATFVIKKPFRVVQLGCSPVYTIDIHWCLYWCLYEPPGSRPFLVIFSHILFSFTLWKEASQDLAKQLTLQLSLHIFH